MDWGGATCDALEATYVSVGDWEFKEENKQEGGDTWEDTLNGTRKGGDLLQELHRGMEEDPVTGSRDWDLVVLGCPEEVALLTITFASMHTLFR